MHVPLILPTVDKVLLILRMQLEGDSMHPTINSSHGNDLVLVEYWNVRRRQLRR